MNSPGLARRCRSAYVRDFTLESGWPSGIRFRKNPLLRVWIFSFRSSASLGVFLWHALTDRVPVVNLSSKVD